MKESSIRGVEPYDCTGVCSLPPDQLEARRGMIRSEILPGVLRQEDLPDGFVCEFDAGMRARLEEWVALERECCSSLIWHVLDAPGGRIRLEVRGAGARVLARLALGHEKRAPSDPPASAGSLSGIRDAGSMEPA